jgi:hypothetical protein
MASGIYIPLAICQRVILLEFHSNSDFLLFLIDNSQFNNFNTLKMKNLLINIFDQLTKAEVCVNKKTARRQISLFEFENSPDLEFNGCKTLSDYQSNIYVFYIECKLKVDDLLNTHFDHSDLIKKEFDLHCFEVQEFRNRFFPKDYIEVLFSRVKLHRSNSYELLNSDTIKKNPRLLYYPIPTIRTIRKTLLSQNHTSRQVQPTSNSFKRCFRPILAH